MDAAYFAALAADKDLGQTRGIDGTLKEFNLDAILLPTNGKILNPQYYQSCQLTFALRIYGWSCRDRRIPGHHRLAS